MESDEMDLGSIGALKVSPRSPSTTTEHQAPLVTIPENWDTMDLTPRGVSEVDLEDESSRAISEDGTTSSSSSSSSSCSHSTSSSGSSTSSSYSSGSSGSSSGEEGCEASSSSSDSESSSTTSSNSNKSCTSSRCKHRRKPAPGGGTPKALLSKKERDTRKNISASSAGHHQEQLNHVRRTFDPGKKTKKWMASQNASYRLQPQLPSSTSLLSQAKGGSLKEIPSQHTNIGLQHPTELPQAPSIPLEGQKELAHPSSQGGSSSGIGNTLSSQSNETVNNSISCGLQVIEDADLVAILKDVSETSGGPSSTGQSLLQPTNSASVLSHEARPSAASSSSNISSNIICGRSSLELGAKDGARRGTKGSESLEEEIRRRRAAQMGKQQPLLHSYGLVAHSGVNASATACGIGRPNIEAHKKPNRDDFLSKSTTSLPYKTASNTILPATQASVSRQRHNSNKKRKGLSRGGGGGGITNPAPPELEHYLNSSSNVSPDSGIQSEGPSLASGSPLHSGAFQTLPNTAAASSSSAALYGPQQTTLSWNGLYYNAPGSSTSTGGYPPQQPQQIIQTAPYYPGRSSEPKKSPLVGPPTAKRSFEPRKPSATIPSDLRRQAPFQPARRALVNQSTQYQSSSLPDSDGRRSSTPPPPTLEPSVILPHKPKVVNPIHHHKKFNNLKTARSYVFGSTRVVHHHHHANPPLPRKMTSETGSQTVESSLEIKPSRPRDPPRLTPEDDVVILLESSDEEEEEDEELPPKISSPGPLPHHPDPSSPPDLSCSTPPRKKKNKKSSSVSTNTAPTINSCSSNSPPVLTSELKAQAPPTNSKKPPPVIHKPPNKEDKKSTQIEPLPPPSKNNNSDGEINIFQGPIQPVFQKTFTLPDSEMFWRSDKAPQPSRKPSSEPSNKINREPSTKTMLEVLAETSKKGKPGRKKKPETGIRPELIKGYKGKKLKKSSWKSKYKNVIDPFFLEEVEDLINDLSQAHIKKKPEGSAHSVPIPPPPVFRKQKFLLSEPKSTKGKRGRPPKRTSEQPPSNEQQRLPLKKRHHHHNKVQEESGHSSSCSSSCAGISSPPSSQTTTHTRVDPLPRRDSDSSQVTSPQTQQPREKPLPFANKHGALKKVCAVTPTVIKSISEISKRKQEIQQQTPPKRIERILYSDEDDSRKNSGSGGSCGSLTQQQQEQVRSPFPDLHSPRYAKKKRRSLPLGSSSSLRRKSRLSISSSTSEEEDESFRKQQERPVPMEVDDHEDPVALPPFIPPDLGSYSDPETTHTKLIRTRSLRPNNTSVSLTEFPLCRNNSVKECSVRVQRLNLHDLLSKTPTFLSEFEKLKEERKVKKKTSEHRVPTPKKKKKKRRTNRTGFPTKKVKKKKILFGSKSLSLSSSLAQDKRPRGRPPKKIPVQSFGSPLDDAIPMNPGVSIPLISEQKRLLPRDGPDVYRCSASKRFRLYEDVDDEIDCLSLLPLVAKNSSSVSEASSSSEEINERPQLFKRGLPRGPQPSKKAPAICDPTAKKYLNAGLFSNFFKSEPGKTGASEGKKISNIYNPFEHPHGLLPPPYYCGRQLRLQKEDFRLPFDLWWLQENKKLPERDVVATWNYKKIKNNVYVDVRQPASKLTNHPCHCRQNSNCGDDCINRMTYTECDPRCCPARDQCTNNAIQRHRVPCGVERFMTEAKGWGVRTKASIKKGTFIMEYVGEIVSEREFKQRMLNEYENDSHHYCLHLESGIVIDGHRMGGECRFVNHACAPNCEMQKWSVHGLNRMALFALSDIPPNEELTYDYNFSLFNPHEGQVCRCGFEQCRGVIGGRTQVVKSNLPSSGSNAHKDRGRDRKQKKNSKGASGSEKGAGGVKKKSSSSLESSVPTLKPLAHSHKIYIRQHRVFLMRNYEKVRKARDNYLATNTSRHPIGHDERNAAEEKIQTGLAALSTSMQTRRIAGAIDDPNVSKVVKLTQIFKEILSQLLTINDQNGRPVADLFRHLPSRAECPKYFSRLQEPIDLSSIEKKLKLGAYSSPESFDRDMITLFQNNLRYYGRFSPQGSASLLLSKHYNAIKADASESILELLGHESLAFRRREEPSRNPEDVIRCICGLYNDEGLMIQCEKCQAWQHCDCVGHQGQDEEKFFCERCSGREKTLDIHLVPQPEYASPGETYFVSLMRENLQVRVGDTVYVLRAFDSISSDTVEKSEFNHGGVPHKMMSPLKGPSNQASSLSKGNYPTYKSVDPKLVSTDDMDIFRIERLWIDTNGERFAFGHHYLRPHETFHEPSRKFFPNEVFRVPLYEVLPLDSIWRQCCVMDIPTFCKGRPAGAIEEHVYICEYRVDKSARLFNKISKPKFPTCLKWFAFDSFEHRIKALRTYTPHEVPEKWSKSTGNSSHSRGKISEEDLRTTSGFLASKRKTLKAKVPPPPSPCTSSTTNSNRSSPALRTATIFKLGQRRHKLERTLNFLLRKISPAGVKNLSHLLESDKQRLRIKKHVSQHPRE